MRNIIILISALLLPNLVNAQVKLNLSYQEATKVYTVSAIPDVTWQSPKNMVSSAQIVFRIDADKDFIPGITSLISGLTWADNAYLERPADAPDYTFVCVSLVNGPTSQIPMVADQEVPLFSFVNTGSGCAGKIEMLLNDDPMVQAVRNAGFNITQHFAVLGARGNAFTGFVNNEVDCSPATGTVETEGKMIDEVKISPVPSDGEVTVQWKFLAEARGLHQMVIYDVTGREVFREEIGYTLGYHKLDINVKNWQAGLYRMRFVFGNNLQSQCWNLMVIH